MEKQLVLRKMGIEDLHQDSKNWISHLHFMADEIIFFDHLLNSYVFEPDTPSLFEDLQKYQRRLKESKKLCSRVIGDILEHENKLGGLVEILNSTLDQAYQTKHQQFRVEVEDCLNDFRRLKSDLFSYASGILKKRHRKK
ncbi:hypothetical protein [uncultured Muriicola sp.]|uniref:hypothetical protein n=1 Tax=uncultured Muriicola sp. TaxID=1583102 RepID=UPI0026289014|nr:hypothetical protein [uncultured Muriicola sp.]